MNDKADMPRVTEAAPELAAETADRRTFIVRLAKAAIIPAVIVGVASNVTSARAGSY